MLSALRIVSPAFSGPIVRIVTVVASGPPFASWIRSASSTANSSSSFMTASVDSRSSVRSAAVSRFSAQESGTCFTQTTMFIGPLLVPSCPSVASARRAARLPRRGSGPENGARTAAVP